MSSQLASERIVIEAPMSFTGSAKRCWNWTKTDNPLVKWLLAVPAAIICIAIMWAIVTVWYVIFGLLMVPWRLIRRGSRKRKLQGAQHRELVTRLDQQAAATAAAQPQVGPSGDA